MKSKSLVHSIVAFVALAALTGTASFVGEIASEVDQITNAVRKFEVENASKDVFLYNDTLAVSLGAPVPFYAGRNSASFTGFLRSNTSGDHDTTTNAENGFFCYDQFRLLYATTTSTTPTPNCTLYVYGDADVKAKLVWSGNKNYWTPTADSSGGWVAPEAVVFDSTDVVALEIVPKSAAPTNPTNPMVRLWLARQE